MQQNLERVNSNDNLNNLEAIETIEVPLVTIEAQEEQPKPENKFGLFTTALTTSLGAAAFFSLGATVKNHPVHNGAVAALAGGTIAGAFIGMIGAYLGIKEKGNSFNLTVCAAMLEWAAALAPLPIGAQLVEQDLSIATLLVDELIGVAVIASPPITLLTLSSCCLLAMYARLPAEERANTRTLLIEKLTQYFSTAQLIIAAAQIENTPEVAATLVEADPETANEQKNADQPTPTALRL